MAVNTIILKSKFYRLFLPILFILVLSSCANIVSPTGGPQDKTPPKVVKSIPKQNETNFNNKVIEIKFDEYIILKDINNQLFISPPLEIKPDIKNKGKSLQIELKEELIPNTTYIFNFGDAITDLHEGNPLNNFNLVFSTGNTVDSMSYSGSVIDALTSEPEKEAIVMLYEKKYDSVPFLEKPIYISKTDSKGNFTFNNIKNQPLKIVAINDLNKNLRYNQYVEKIAFETNLVNPIFIPQKFNDSTSKDTINSKIFSKDTLNQNILRIFLETLPSQRVLKSSFLTEFQAIIKFQKADKKIEIKNINIPNNQFIEEWNELNDTLTLWLLNKNIDSIKINLSDNSQFSDTIIIAKSNLNKKIPLTNTISPTPNITPIFDYFNKIKLTFPFPLSKIDSIMLTLIENSDTNNVIAYRLDNSYRKYEVKTQLKQNTDYQLIIESQDIQDIHSKKTINLNTKFKTNGYEDFGNLTIEYIAKDTLYFRIIQIINEKNQVINEISVKGNKKIIFNNLKPGSYSLKVIVDENKNGKWDTGNYLLKIQPEKTYNFPSKVNIKAYWDVEERWVE